MGRVIIFLLACLFVFSIAHTVSAETETQLNISNAPPVLLQEMSDILIIVNTPRIDAFDLDDYFYDVNGEGLTFNYTELNNVTVTIDSENLVSFYPDIGYSGSQSMQFSASDGAMSVSSNTFQVTVGEDTAPPQWSRMRKNVVSVYQNYHVTFSADWTDNVGLKEFIFSINQGSGWQNQTATELTGMSNTSSFKIQISAAAGQQVSWKFYAKDVYDNMNITDEQNFTVKEFVIDPDAVYDGDIVYDGEPVEGTAGAVSYGTGEVKLDYFKEGVLAENLEVDTRSIKVSLKQGASITKVVKIINTGNTNIRIDASLINMDLFAILGDTAFEILPGETHEILVEFTIPKTTMPDQYFGFLILDYGDKISIPIVVDVKEFESEVRINITLTEDSKTIRVGEKATVLVVIKNLKDMDNSTSQLYYALKDFNGNIIESSSEDIVLPAVFEEERTLTVPEGTRDGEYIFYARIISGDAIDLDSDTLLIGARFKIVALFKKLFYPLTIFILLIILLLLYLIYKRNKKKKRLLELYLLLNELRGLVKEGKTMQAMDIYKRIKLTYGQHVSKGFAENEPKLREELDKFSKILAKSEATLKEPPKPESKPSVTTATPPVTKLTPTDSTSKPATKPTPAPTKPIIKPAIKPSPKPEAKSNPKEAPVK